MNFDLENEVIKVAIKSLKDIAANVLTEDDYKSATFNYNKATGKVDIENISEESMTRLSEAVAEANKK